MSNFLKTKNYIYQIGNGRSDFFIFPKTEFGAKVSKPLKQSYSESNFIDGQIRTNLLDRNLLSSAEFNIDFYIEETNYFDLNFVKKMFVAKPTISFYYQTNASEDLNIFFNPTTDIVNTVDQQESSSSSDGQSNLRVNAGLKLPLPFLYECKPSIAYFDYSSFVISQLLYGGGDIYGGGAVYGQADILSTILLSSLSIENKLNFFTSCNSNKALVYIDKFFNKSFFSIEAGQEVVNLTLVNNSLVNTPTSNIYRKTTADNRIYLIESSGILNTNEWFSIVNTDNQSSIKVTWTGVSASPAVVYYNSYWERLYDSLGVEINPLNYRIDQDQPHFLYFTPLASQNRTLNIQTENLRIQKTSINNLTIKLENLNTYHI